MDPAVTAALVAGPFTVIAAVGAYAAGRAQARGAQRGPVDAVRRQHQRDAYAAYVAALHAYEAATKWDSCYERAMTDALAAGVQPGPGLADHVEERARLLIAAVSVDELMRTGATVELEGPEDIAAFAMITLGAARQIWMAARRPISSPADYAHLLAAHGRLSVGLSGFVKAARAHLNGDG